MFVVKANAYGHGLKEVVEITRDLPFIDYYAVDNVFEAGIVRGICQNKKILVIGWESSEAIEEMIAGDFEFIVPSMDYYRMVSEAESRVKKGARIHVKIETGTSRLGMSPAEFLKLAEICKQSDTEIAGLYSHFANIEDTTDHSYAMKQLDVFNRLISSGQLAGIRKHFSCSASALLFPETYFDTVRVGISAYGYWPSRETFISYTEKKREKIRLKPVLSWHSRVAQVKDLSEGSYVGYGLTYQTFGDAKMAVIPVGYYDGYDRKLSNVSTILINGSRAPVRGRICMDMFMAEVSHIKNVKEGDPVMLIGESKNERLDAGQLADWMGSIHYEVLARINPNIPRVVV